MLGNGFLHVRWLLSPVVLSANSHHWSSYPPSVEDRSSFSPRFLNKLWVWFSVCCFVSCRCLLYFALESSLQSAPRGIWFAWKCGYFKRSSANQGPLWISAFNSRGRHSGNFFWRWWQHSVWNCRWHSQQGIVVLLMAPIHLFTKKSSLTKIFTVKLT